MVLRPARREGRQVTATEVECRLNAKGLTAALVDGAEHVSVPGYQPVPIHHWKVTDDDSLVCAVTFGSYRGPVSYDRYVILDGDTIKLSIPEDSRVSLPAGVTWEWTFELASEAA